MEAEDQSAGGRDKVCLKPIFSREPDIERDEDEQNGGFEPPIFCCAQPGSGLTELPEVPTEMDGGVGV